MLCDVCKVNKATVHIVRIVNSVKQEMNLCENCAGHSKDAMGMKSMNFGNAFSFQNALSGLVDYMNEEGQSRKGIGDACPTCGNTYEQFKEIGLMGCSNCYEYFSAQLEQIIKRVQGNTEHVGKIPMKTGKDIMDKRKLIQLKESLQKAILLEEYEKAALIRDEIRQLKDKGGEE